MEILVPMNFIHNQMHLAKLWVASSLLPLLSSHEGLSGMRARRRMGRIGMRAPGKVVSRHGRAQPRMYISRLPARQTKYSIPLWSIRFENFDIKRPIFRGIIDTIKEKMRFKPISTCVRRCWHQDYQGSTKLRGRDLSDKK